MVIVKTLKEDVYKKIAAGEVVERPLSVVKELVENSIDAGADSIKIEVSEGGKRLIKITDNGSGFDPDDIETAFKNHSTSKLREISDFDTLQTLGFRGEALPSILEVSKIDLETANNNDGAGIRCIFEEGRLLQREQIACSRGTLIAVKDLFFNYPVRKKFLKVERTELAQILSYMEPVTLVNYGISFELTHNGKSVFVYKKAENLKERIYQVFGKDFLDSLQEIDISFENYRVTGFISRVNTGESVKKHQYYFVNGRAIKEKTLMASFNNTFTNFLEKNKYPVGILLLTIPPREVDVNIHPMKLEIKFEDANAIYRFIKYALESTLSSSDAFAARSMQRAQMMQMDQVIHDTSRPVFNYGNYGNRSQGNPGQNYNSGRMAGEIPPRWEDRMSPGSSLPGIGMPEKGALSPGDFEQQLFAGNFLNEDNFNVIGQYRNSYILVEKKGELILIDQHNAQERINFDKLKKQYTENNVLAISPLFPVIIELSASEIGQLSDEKKNLLEKFGFQLEPLSRNAFDVKSFPQVLEEKSIRDALLEIIHMPGDELNFEDKVLAEVACKSAIKVNHKLYPEQMKTIVINLFQSTNPYFCPHKRPIMIEFTLEEIEKRLKRK
ncbi:MAG: DNA mismatch repair endonuclease MutL [Acidobacteria bacterium]|jgi:DNA mismatch repair protein MutL|nr:DNA mismatch repair endonuclease MutL [Acidobacteriota bacterium]